MKIQDDLSNPVESQMEQLLENQTLAIDMLGALTCVKTEETAVDEIRNIFSQVFSPTEMVYVSIADNEARQFWPSEALPSSTRELMEWVKNEPHECMIAPSLDGFRFRISHQSEVVGVISLEGIASPQYCQRYINFCQALTPICGLVITHLRKQKKLAEIENAYQQDALIETMPGVSNHHQFFEVADAEFKRSKRYHRPLSAILIDVDDFSELTRNYGAAAGNQLLLEISRVLKKELRDSDIRVRMGGEEFLILLPETALRYAQSLAERLRRRIVEMSLEIEDQVVTTTISLGVVSLDRSIQSLEEFVSFADQALCQAKRNGNNQVGTWAAPVKEYEPVFKIKETDYRIGFY